MSRITIKSLQAQIENLKADLKTTEGYIIAANELLTADICDPTADFVMKVEAVVKGLKAASNLAQRKPVLPQADKLVQGGRDPVVIHTDAETVHKGMVRALTRVKFQRSVRPEFFNNFVISINKEGRWFAFLPLKESAETKQFAKEFVTAARAAGFEKANYKQGGGAWFIY